MDLRYVNELVECVIWLQYIITMEPKLHKMDFIVYGDKMIEGIDYFEPNNWEIQPLLRDYQYYFVQIISK